MWMHIHPQVKWLLAEHTKTQKALESMYDEEISRQRMNLEERLARRKALAQAAVWHVSHFSFFPSQNSIYFI